MFCVVFVFCHVLKVLGKNLAEKYIGKPFEVKIWCHVLFPLKGTMADI